MGVKRWNDLPLEIRSSTSKFLLKRKLKVHVQNAMRMKTKIFHTKYTYSVSDIQFIFHTVKGLHFLGLATLRSPTNRKKTLLHLRSIEVICFAIT